ncbi:MAG: hypothetical protein D6723_08940 [Acidobacteria bacterium]|nr:MAG: hypothetical protein D6723_08940 [Acidobacteriota bacterium]
MVGWTCRAPSFRFMQRTAVFWFVALSFWDITFHLFAPPHFAHSIPPGIASIQAAPSSERPTRPPCGVPGHCCCVGHHHHAASVLTLYYFTFDADPGTQPERIRVLPPWRASFRTTFIRAPPGFSDDIRS